MLTGQVVTTVKTTVNGQDLQLRWVQWSLRMEAKHRGQEDSVAPWHGEARSAEACKAPYSGSNPDAASRVVEVFEPHCLPWALGL